MNTKELTKKADRVAGALSGIGIALECLAILVGIVLIVSGMAATDSYGGSAPSAASILTGFAVLMSTVWIYALFGFLEYVLRLLTALVKQNNSLMDLDDTLSEIGKDARDADFDEHVATAPGLSSDYLDALAKEPKGFA